MTTNLSMYRQWTLTNLNLSIPIYGHFAKTLSQKDATTLRDGGDGWTLVEVMCHMRDTEDFFLKRAEVTIAEDKPALPSFDPDQLAAERNYNAETLTEVYAVWKKKRERTIQFMSELDENLWARAGMHPKRGEFTLNDQMIFIPLHDSMHIEQITKILEQKQP